MGLVVFEELMIMKSAWGPNLCDIAASNAAQIEDENGLLEFEQMLVDNVDLEEWSKSVGELNVDGL